MDLSLQPRARCAVPIGPISVNDEFIALEIDGDRCGRLQFELPLDVTDAEIEYIRSLVPSLQSGTLELRDPNTGEVMFTCTPVLVH